MNMSCSEYLYEKKTLNNEDVFYLIRYALTGNPVGAPIGDIAEVLGRKNVVMRVGEAAQLFSQ